MENPIINNRIVSNLTFAKRLKSFLEQMDCMYDQCMQEEKEMLLSNAERLLKYQVLTATDLNEIDYLMRLNLFDEYQPKVFIKTEDGFDIFDTIFDTPFKDGEVPMVYSVMSSPQKGESVMTFQLRDKNRFSNINPNRIFFRYKENAETYINQNTKQYSAKEVTEILERELALAKGKDVLFTNEDKVETKAEPKAEDEIESVHQALENIFGVKLVKFNIPQRRQNEEPKTYSKEDVDVFDILGKIYGYDKPETIQETQRHGRLNRTEEQQEKINIEIPTTPFVDKMIIKGIDKENIVDFLSAFTNTLNSLQQQQNK